MKIKIYFDGACNNHAELKPMGIGVAVFINEDYEESLSLAIGINDGDIEDSSTSNIAEWIGCTKAMETAAYLRKEYPHSTIEIFSDSQIITRQFNDIYQIKKIEFLKYKQQAKQHWLKARSGHITWIRRELNTTADMLSKEGIQIAIKNKTK